MPVEWMVGPAGALLLAVAVISYLLKRTLPAFAQQLKEQQAAFEKERALDRDERLRDREVWLAEVQANREVLTQMSRRIEDLVISINTNTQTTAELSRLRSV